MEKSNRLTEKQHLMNENLDEMTLCKICLTADKSKNNVTSKNIYTIIPNPNVSHCKCQSFSHDDCLINWCLMKYTLQCPDCNMFYNMEIEKFVDERNYSYGFIVNILIFLISIGTFLSISVNYFIYGDIIFSQVNEFWSIFIGTTSLLFFLGSLYLGYINKRIFYQEKDYIFQIKLLEEDKTYEKIHKISHNFLFLLKRLYKYNSGDIFLSKIDENIFQKIEFQKKTEISNATKGRIARAVSINAFVDINNRSIKRKNSNYGIKKKDSAPLNLQPNRFLNRIATENKTILLMNENYKRKEAEYSKTHMPRVKKVISTSMNRQIDKLEINNVIEEHPQEKSPDRNGLDFSSKFGNEDSDDSAIFEDQNEAGLKKLDSEAVLVLEEKINSINKINPVKFNHTTDSNKNRTLSNNHKDDSNILASTQANDDIKNNYLNDKIQEKEVVIKNVKLSGDNDINKVDVQKELKLKENNIVIKDKFLTGNDMSYQKKQEEKLSKFNEKAKNDDPKNNSKNNPVIIQIESKINHDHDKITEKDEENDENQISKIEIIHSLKEVIVAGNELIKQEKIVKNQSGKLIKKDLNEEKLNTIEEKLDLINKNKTKQKNEISTSIPLNEEEVKPMTFHASKFNFL